MITPGETTLIPAKLIREGDRCTIKATVDKVIVNTYGETFIQWKLDNPDQGSWQTELHKDSHIRVLKTSSIAKREMMQKPFIQFFVNIKNNIIELMKSFFNMLNK